MFIPATPEEVQQLGWKQLDVILVSGDSYIDSPYSGIAVIGKVLMNAGYKVGVIAQPDVRSEEEITRFGEPALFWGVSGGAVDSMVANYTAAQRKRRTDDFTPGGVNDRRPDRAVIAYTNLIKRHYKSSKPIVLGGIEASLRRITHYDYWSDRLRAPILFDSKADFLLYGMAERSVLELADALKSGSDPKAIRGLCYLSKEVPDGYLELPSYEETLADQDAFIRMFELFYHNNDPLTARGLAQKKADRFVVQNPPAPLLSQEELDRVYALEYERKQHPYYEKQGSVKALETIQFSIPTHRGCYGECNFCAIAVHEGRTVTSRSVESILTEARSLAAHPDFKGVINDLSGPTANMYEIECLKKLKNGACEDKRCLFPEICPALKVDHSRQVDLLRKIRQIPGIKKVFVGSGIRYDMVLADRAHGIQYLSEIVRSHVSGQLKVAPEHSEPAVLKLMGKPPIDSLMRFRDQFDNLSKQAGKEQYLTYYLIAAYPGCNDQDMRNLHKFVSSKLHINPEQVQIFTPTPSTYASLMYYTEKDPFTGQKIFVEKNLYRKTRQKDLVTGEHNQGQRPGSHTAKSNKKPEFSSQKSQGRKSSHG